MGRRRPVCRVYAWSKSEVAVYSTGREPLIRYPRVSWRLRKSV